jgi:hypothetical protein
MRLTMKAFLLRGLAAGAAGGTAAALFTRFVTETQIGYALRFEDATSLGAPTGEAAEFSRSTQHLGGMAAATLYGVLLGVVLAVVAAALHDRIRGHNEFGRIAKVAASAFVATALLPGLKYPPNPPTVGDPDTISERTTAYLTLTVASVVIVVLAWLLWGALTRRGLLGGDRFLVTTSAFLLMVTAAFLVWPASPDRIEPPVADSGPALVIADTAPPEVLDQLLETARETGDPALRDRNDPAEPLDLTTVERGADLVGTPVAVSTTKLVPNAYTTMVWAFRLRSFAGLAILWAVMAGVLGLLLDRAVKRDGPVSTIGP